MSTIVKTAEKLKQYVVVSTTLQTDHILKFIKTAERQYIKPVIGEEQYNAFAEAEPDEETKALEAFKLLEEASSNIALLKFTKVGAVNITDHGLSVSHTQSSKTAEWWQVRDLRRELLSAGLTAIDEALAVMEANPLEFADWVNSTAYTIFKELFVKQTSEFQTYYNINNSRNTFVKLRPHLLKVEQKYFKSLLGEETMSVIKAASTAETKEALKLCQAAQVSLCISEIAAEGIFLITPTGLFITTDEIQGEKKQALDEASLNRLEYAKSQDGQGYLKNLIAHLKKYPLVFTDYAAKEAIEQKNPTYGNKSVFSL